MNLNDIKKLFRFQEWARQRTLKMLEPLKQEDFEKDLGGSMKSIRATLVHMISAEEIWIKRLRNETNLIFGKEEDFPHLKDSISRWEKVSLATQEYINALTDEKVMQMAEYKDLKGNIHKTPVDEILHHVNNHTTYHRGQLVNYLRMLGYSAMNSDAIGFYREQGEKK